MPDLSADDIALVEIVLQTERQARNAFARQIVEFTRKLSEGRTVREIDVLLAVALYVEQECRAI